MSYVFIYQLLLHIVTPDYILLLTTKTGWGEAVQKEGQVYVNGAQINDFYAKIAN